MTTTISINGNVISGNVEDIRALLGLQAMAEVSAAQTIAESKPVRKSRKSKKSKKSQPVIAETRMGRVYYTPSNHQLTAHQVKRLEDAVLKMREAGFDKAEWRIEGTWAWIYPFTEEKGTGYSIAFKTAASKAFKGSKWEYCKSRGAVVYKDFIRAKKAN